MRMIGYYAFHSVKNQIRKLLRSWVIVLILVCALIGGLIGIGVAALEDLSGGAEGEYTEEYSESEFADGEDGLLGFADQDAQGVGEDPQNTDEDETSGQGADEDDWALDPDYVVDPDTYDDAYWEAEIAFEQNLSKNILELILGGLLIFLIVFEVLGADRNGGRIFLMADVNLLFSAPLTPQFVLMFRLLMQAGAALFASIYLLFQLPNLTRGLDLTPWGLISLFVVWFMTILFGRLLTVFVYTVTATEPKRKKMLLPVVYGCLAVIAGAFFLYYQKEGGTVFEAACGFFNSRYSRWIPVWGWLKGIALYAIEENILLSLLCLALMLIAFFLLIVLIRHTKADFYEDAMAKSEQTAQLLADAQNSGKLVVSNRKRKAKEETVKKDGLRHGFGANVFFFKSMYNRFRFATLGIFTKTAWTYFAVGVLMTAVLKFIFRTNSVLPVALAFGVVAFYRAMGNPLGEDTGMEFFRMIPESPIAKVFWSLLAGSVNCLLDIVPGLLVSTILLRGNLLTALSALVLIVSVDFFATAAVTFINLAIPKSVDKSFKQVFVVLFIYFGLLPDIAVLAVSFVLGHYALGIGITVILNALLGVIFMLLAAWLVKPKAGRGK